MTSTDPAPQSRTGRITRRIVIGIILFAALYSAMWFLAARQIESRLPALLQPANAGASGECDGLQVRGFPFRIGVFCTGIRADDRQRGLSLAAGALRSTADIYWPGHGTITLDGPADIRTDAGLAVSAGWTFMQTSLQATFSGLSRLSVASDKLQGTATLPETGDRLTFAARHGEARLNDNAGDLDAAFEVEAFDVNQGLLPPLDLKADLTLDDRAFLLDAGGLTKASLRNSKGELRNLTLDLGNGLTTVASGPFSINDQGLISGEFSVTMNDIEGWRQNLVKVFTDRNGTVMVNNIANMLTALSNGGNEATVKLNVRDGTAFLAFFPIGELPQL